MLDVIKLWFLSFSNILSIVSDLIYALVFESSFWIYTRLNCLSIYFNDSQEGPQRMLTESCGACQRFISPCFTFNFLNQGSREWRLKTYFYKSPHRDFSDNTQASHPGLANSDWIQVEKNKNWCTRARDPMWDQLQTQDRRLCHSASTDVWTKLEKGDTL